MIQERLTKRRRCTAKKRNGDRCGAFALHNEKLCIWHSDSKKAKSSKNKPYAVKSSEELILILQKELNRIRKKTKAGNVIKRASEIRQLVQLISELKSSGKKLAAVGDGSQTDTFEEKVARAKKRKGKDG